ncbi:MAG: hypothetical protein K5925_00835 [Bacilli bacterium]|nr:hypothetical protein [Bacilli bacterium]
MEEPEELLLDTTTRIQTILLIENSNSMKESFDLLKAKVSLIINYLKSDDATSQAFAELAVIDYGKNAEVIEPFKGIKEYKRLKLISDVTEDSYNLNKGLAKAIELSLERKEFYKENGLQFFQPLFFVLLTHDPDDKEYCFFVNNFFNNHSYRNKGSLIFLYVGNESLKQKLEEIYPNGYFINLESFDEKNISEIYESATFISSDIVLPPDSNKETVKLDEDVNGWLDADV